MHATRLQAPKQAIALALALALMAGCSSTTTADALAFDEASALANDLSHALSATRNAVSNSAEPASAARAIDRASAAAKQLAATATEVQTPEIRAAVDVLTALADRIVTELTRAQVGRAEALFDTSFAPLASQFATMEAEVPGSAHRTDSRSGTGLIAAFVVLVMIAVGVVGYVDRRRRRPVQLDPSPNEAPDERIRREQPTQPPHGQVERSDATDSARATRMRPTDIELRPLLVSTVEHALERGWVVSLDCPAEVHVSGDPVRTQRAILAMLGNAFLEGAERAGIVVEVNDRQVQLSIGHDAPIDDQTAEAITVRLAGQLASALDRRHLGWSVATDDGIYLATVSAERERTRAGAGVPA